jgi:hypothetical protein
MKRLRKTRNKNKLRHVHAEALLKMKGGLHALNRTLEWTRSRPLARPFRAFCFAKWNSRSCEVPPEHWTCRSSRHANLSPFPKRLKCPGANPLKNAHAALATAVLAAYGFSAKKDLLAQLLALNQQVAAKIEKGESVTAPRRAENVPRPEEPGDGGLHYATVADTRRTAVDLQKDIYVWN